MKRRDLIECVIAGAFIAVLMWGMATMVGAG